jgi:hypothetical protein
MSNDSVSKKYKISLNDINIPMLQLKKLGTALAKHLGG